MRRRLAAGNWKMHGLADSLTEIAELSAAHPDPACDILICPPATLIHRAADLTLGSSVAIGAQDCHAGASGAHTGDISACMLRDAGATAVILGHSERRADHGETDAAIRAKARAALEAGLLPVICLGETLAQRDAGDTLGILSAQLALSLPDEARDHPIVIAYEPVWAIGSGLTPDPAQIGEVHAHIRAELSARFGRDMAQATRILYGGSVKPANAAAIFAARDVDGALVGGASLTSADFSPIIAALCAAG